MKHLFKSGINTTEMKGGVWAPNQISTTQVNEWLTPDGAVGTETALRSISAGCYTGSESERLAGHSFFQVAGVGFWKN